jgi:hypothetical protein
MQNRRSPAISVPGFLHDAPIGSIRLVGAFGLVDEVVDHVATAEQDGDTNQHRNEERHDRLLSLFVLAI